MFNVSFPGLGIDVTINRVAFSIGGVFDIYWYALFIVSGLLLAMLYAHFNAKRFGVNLDKLLNCVIVGLITAIIGARLYYVIFKWEYFADDLTRVFYLRDGGLAIYGGIIGALLGGLITAKIQKMKLLPVLDLALIGFLIGQSVGRWGNFMNQEAFGVETDSLFRMVSEGTGGVAVHPCFLYESVWCALGVLLLHIFSKKWQKYYGQVAFLYMIWYGSERFFVEGLRTDSLYLPFTIGNYELRVSQLLSLALVIAGVVLLIVCRNRDDHIRDKHIRDKQDSAQEVAIADSSKNEESKENTSADDNNKAAETTDIITETDNSQEAENV